MAYTFEVCASGVDSVLNAFHGGAQRVELCSSLIEGGITPSYGTVKRTMELAGDKITVHVLVRARGGDFLYSDDEIALMCEDIDILGSLGVHGVVIGALCSDGSLDKRAMDAFMLHTGSMSVTFHRAFDVCSDPYKMIDDLRCYGIDRVLSSGMKATALEGAANLRDFAQYAGGSFKFLAGGGISKGNIGFVRNISCLDEFHFSARVSCESAMNYRNDEVSMSAQRIVLDDFKRDVSGTDLIRDIIGSLK